MGAKPTKTKYEDKGRAGAAAGGAVQKPKHANSIPGSDFSLPGMPCNDVSKLETFMAINMLQFQQPINCCNITALAYAMTAVRRKMTTVNDMFHMAKLPGNYVVLDGLSLAQTFNAGTMVAAAYGDIFLEAYWMDRELVSYEAFKAAIASDGDRIGDVLIVNFSVKIAHQWEQGGGHYALIGYVNTECGPNGEKGDFAVTMCETHPLKYGKTWVVNSRHLFDAMVDKDGVRSRGIIRVALSECHRRILTPLLAVQRSICYCDASYTLLKRRWLSHWAELPAESFQSVLNLGGVAAVALAVTGLMRSAGLERFVDADEVMRTLKLDHARDLMEVDQPVDVLEHLVSYASAVGAELRAYKSPMAKTPELMMEDLKASLRTDGSCALMLFDLNVAASAKLIVVDPKSEAARFSHFAKHWSVVVDVPDASTVVLADPRAKTMSRLWATSAKELWAACQAIETKEFIVCSMLYDKLSST